MSENVIYDEMIGKLERDGDEWRADWKWNDEQTVSVAITFDDEPHSLPQEVKNFLVQLKEKDALTRTKISEKMLKLCNEDWNPGANLTQNELAERIRLDGVLMYYPTVQAEIFYDDDDIFAGHAIAAFADLSAEISEPYLAG